MIKTLYRLSCLAFIVVLSSCASSKPLTSSVVASEIDDVLQFETISLISLIEKGNQSVLNDSVSGVSQEMLGRIMNDYKKGLSVQFESIALDDSTDREIFIEEVFTLIAGREKAKRSGNVGIPPLINHILAANDKRFGLIIVNTGFVRGSGNYGKQIAKGLGIGLLTLGKYYQVPYKASSNVYALIVDRENNNVAFYNKSFMQDREPVEYEVLEKQVLKIFDNYFTRRNTIE